MTANSRKSFIKSFLNPLKTIESLNHWIYEENEATSFDPIESDIAAFLKSSEAELAGLDDSNCSREDIARHIREQLEEARSEIAAANCEQKQSPSKKTDYCNKKQGGRYGGGSKALS